MIIADGEIVFESRDAIEARVKETWMRHGFSVSFEPFSVAQRLVDVWVELLWASQETTRDLYSRLSLNSSGADLDRFVQKLGVQRIIFPQLAFVWRNVRSEISDRNFTYIVMPLDIFENNNLQVRYRFRRGQVAAQTTDFEIRQSMSEFKSRLAHVQDNTQEVLGEDGEVIAKIGDMLVVMEAEIMDIRAINNRPEIPEPIIFPIISQTLYPHSSTFLMDHSLVTQQGGGVEYRNSNLAYAGLNESDDALRSRIITNGLSIAACETMLNKICARSKVELMNSRASGRPEFRIIMIGFIDTEANRRAFFDILESYLPADFLFNRGNATAIQVEDSGEVEMFPSREIIDASSNVTRTGYFFTDNSSVLRIEGITDAQKEMLVGGLPASITYPLVWVALGTTFTNSVVNEMTIMYRRGGQSIGGAVGEWVVFSRTPDENGNWRTLNSRRDTIERGTRFRVI